jgi:hypothetical protein
MGHAVGPQPGRGVVEARLLGRPQRAALPPPRQEGPPRVGLRGR